MGKKVCVFGSYKDLGKKVKEDIVKLGKLLAEKGYTVVNGGFGGTMEDISRGAKEAGGRTIGVTYYKKKGPKKGGLQYCPECKHTLEYSHFGKEYCYYAWRVYGNPHKVCPRCEK